MPRFFVNAMCLPMWELNKLPVYNVTHLVKANIQQCFMIDVFLCDAQVKTLRLQLLSGAPAPEVSPYAAGAGGAGARGGGAVGAGGTKRRVYFLLFVAVTQPLLSCWLTYHLVPPPAAPAAP